MTKIFLLCVLMCAGLAVAAEKSDPPDFPGVTSGLHDPVTSNTFLMSSDGVYVTDRKQKEWNLCTFPSSPSYIPHSVVGGSVHRVVVNTSLNNVTRVLLAISDTTRPAIILKDRSSVGGDGNTPSPIVFFTEKVGLIAKKNTLGVTTDGGVTSKNAIQIGKDDEPIRFLTLMSDHAAIAVGDDKSVSIVELKDNLIHVKWSIQIEDPPWQMCKFGNDRLLGISSTLRMMDLTNGQQIGPSLALDSRLIDKVAAHDESIYLYGDGGLLEYTFGKNGFTKKSQLTQSRVRFVWSSDQGTFALVADQDSADVKIFKIEGEKLVRDVPQDVARPAPQVDAAAMKQIDDMLYWGDKLDFATRNRIAAEANSHTEWPPSRRLEWAIEQYKKAAADSEQKQNKQPKP